MLRDLITGEAIGPATEEQIQWAAEYGERDTGAFLIDADGVPRHAGDWNPTKLGPLRTVYIDD